MERISEIAARFKETSLRAGAGLRPCLRSQSFRS